RSFENVFVYELHCGSLFLTREGSEPHTWLISVFLLGGRSANNVRDVSNLEPPLTNEPSVKFGEIVVVFGGMNRGSHQHRHDALDVLQSKRSRLDGICISYRLCLFARISAVAVRCREAVPRNRILLTRPHVECRAFFVGSVRCRNRSVAPHHGEAI